MLLSDAVGKGSPDQPRDDHGRFGSGSGAGGKVTAYDARQASARAAQASDKADSRGLPSKLTQFDARDPNGRSDAESRIKVAVRDHKSAISAHLKAAAGHRIVGNAEQAREHEASADTHRSAIRSMGGTTRL